MSHFEAENITIREIAEKTGLSIRQTQRLLAREDMPGISRRADGYHNAYKLTPELQNWIMARKRKPKGSIPGGSNVHAAARAYAGDLFRAIWIIEALHKTILKSKKRSDVRRLQNNLIKVREGVNTFTPPSPECLNRFLASVPSGTAATSLKAHEAVQLHTEALPILQYSWAFACHSGKALHGMFTDTEIDELL